MDMKKALRLMVTAGRESLKKDTELRNLGYTDTPYLKLHCQIADAIYYLIGETTEDFTNSVTYAAMRADAFTDDGLADFLHMIYAKNC